jgi:heme/copper-type cytochrome/quinol oxidase subunit 4
MVDALLHVIGKIFGSGYTLMVPLSALAVSVAYYRNSPTTQPVLLRLLASAHGVSIALLWSLMLFWIAQSQDAAWRLTAFECLLLLPVALIIVSFFVFQGPRKVHLLQAVNLGSLIYVGLVGAFFLSKWNFF